MIGLGYILDRSQMNLTVTVLDFRIKLECLEPSVCFLSWGDQDDDWLKLW